MPKLWSTTVESHRREVRAAILDATAALAAEHGLRAVTMSQVAESAGIGRATLYKYFPDVEAILGAWHEHQVRTHLDHLAAVRDRARDPQAALAAVLEAYALIQHESHGRHDPGIEASLHAREHMGHARHRLHGLVRELLEAGDVREDVPPDELAAYCLQALGAGAGLPSKAAVRRLVAVVRDGLRPPR